MNDEFIYNYGVDATVDGVFIPWGYHQPSSQHFCVDMNNHTFKLTVYKTYNFWNTKASLPQE